MLSSLNGCCCGSTAQAAATQAAAAATTTTTTGAAHDHGATTAMTMGGGSTTQTSNGVRDEGKAQQWLDYIKQQIVPRWTDFNAAQQAGYVRNPSSGNDAIQHYIHNGQYSVSDPNNVAFPATLMYKFEKGQTTLVGVMITAKPGMQLPDYGAGAWHHHPGDDRLNMHVWFDKTVQGGAFENNSGTI